MGDFFSLEWHRGHSNNHIVMRLILFQITLLMCASQVALGLCDGVLSDSGFEH